MRNAFFWERIAVLLASEKHRKRIREKTMGEQKEGLLSVVVPAYKTEAYLDRCIESIVNQTYSNLEIILVDDGSPDRCPEICDHWAEKDHRILVIHKENGGISSARNAGIAQDTGEYLTFVDSDDYIAENMYEILIAAMRRTGAEIACCGMYFMKNGEIVSTHSRNQEASFTAEEALKCLLLKEDFYGGVCDKVFQKRMFNGIEFPKGEIYEDLAIIPRVMDRAGILVHVGVPLYYYCMDGASITRSTYSPRKRILLQRFDDIEKDLQKEHKDLIPCMDVLQADSYQGILYSLLDNSKIRKQYKNDYQLFIKRFRKSFPHRIRMKATDKGELFKGILIYCGLYYYLHELKRKIWKLSGNSWG